MGWKEEEKALAYYEATKNLPPHKLTTTVARMVIHRPATAMDLGAGALNDSNYLIEQGFQVLAVDQNKEISSYAKNLNSPLLKLKICDFTELSVKPYSFDLITSEFSLPFIPKREVTRLVQNIKCWLKPNGLFAANVLGKDDAWNTPGNNMSFYEKVEITDLLLTSGFHVPMLTEHYSNEPTATGQPKEWWHIFEFIAQNPS